MLDLAPHCIKNITIDYGSLTAEYGAYLNVVLVKNNSIYAKT